MKNKNEPPKVGGNNAGQTPPSVTEVPESEIEVIDAKDAVLEPSQNTSKFNRVPIIVLGIIFLVLFGGLGAGSYWWTSQEDADEFMRAQTTVAKKQPVCLIGNNICYDWLVIAGGSSQEALLGGPQAQFDTQEDADLVIGLLDAKTGSGLTPQEVTVLQKVIEDLEIENQNLRKLKAEGHAVSSVDPDALKNAEDAAKKAKEERDAAIQERDDAKSALATADGDAQAIADAKNAQRKAEEELKEAEDALKNAEADADRERKAKEVARKAQNKATDELDVAVDKVIDLERVLKVAEAKIIALNILLGQKSECPLLTPFGISFEWRIAKVIVVRGDKVMNKNGGDIGQNGNILAINCLEPGEEIQIQVVFDGGKNLVDQNTWKLSSTVKVYYYGDNAVETVPEEVVDNNGMKMLKINTAVNGRKKK